MTKEQKYLFDLQGYLMVKNVLTSDECDMAIGKIKERAHTMDTTPDGISTDSVSFLYALSDSEAQSRREWIYADEFYGGFDGVLGADYAMRNDRYKLLRFQGNEEFYDLQEDPYELNNLLAGELSEHERLFYSIGFEF